MPARVLVIDDVVRWREVFREILTDMGMEVDLAEDDRAAKELLRRGRYDLAVVDVVLSRAGPPAESQLFFRYLQREYPDMPVIAATGADLPPTQVFGLPGLGVREFIHKPRFLVDEFRAGVQRALGGGPPEPAATRPSVPFDAFVSYSHEDHEWVRQVLVPGLEAEGLRICVDSRDFEPGAYSIDEMERCVRESRKTLLVLTPAYVRSEWTRFESVLAQTLESGPGRRRVLPLLVEPCTLPLRLSALAHVDFTNGGDAGVQLARLARAIRRD